MEKKYKIKFKTVSGYEREVTVVARSKYDAKKRFYMKHPKAEITSVKEMAAEPQ
ncbi:MAG: hypothetical protein IJ459_01920 [Clostridia bacterium]|nr:hypothetical protein [Clostridia bacterium]